MLLVKLQFRKGSSTTANMTETMQVTCLKGKHRLIYMLKGTFSFREVRRERILDNRNKALKVQEKQAAMMEKVILMMFLMMSKIEN